MKKVFTLMLSAILFTSAFAQNGPGYKNDRGYDKRNDVGIRDDRNRRDDDRFEKVTLTKKRNDDQPDQPGIRSKNSGR